MRTSEPRTLFSSTHVVTDGADFWQTILTGAGATTHLPNEAAVRLRCGTDSGDAVVRQTYRYFPYIPGKSQLIFLTGTVGDETDGVRKRWGYFDSADGLFWEQTAAGVSVVRRSSVTGSPVDVAVAQVGWNLDPCDGLSPSGITIDWATSQVFVIDFAWLGVSRARMGVVIDGQVIYVHEWLNANVFPGVYMSRANLPVRYEIENLDDTEAATDLLQICSTVITEGGGESDLSTRIRTANNGTASVSVTTRRAVLSIRPAATFNGRVNRGLIAPLDISLTNISNQSVLVEVVRGGALGGTPSWSAVSPSSIVERDSAGTTVTGGEVIWSGYVVASSQNPGHVNLPIADLAKADIPLTVDAAGANPVSLSVVVTSLGSAATVYAAMTWREVY
jgi:hypothetical protein